MYCAWPTQPAPTRGRCPKRSAGGRRSGRPQRHPGPRRRGHASTGSLPSQIAAHLQLRTRAAAGERHAAPAPRTRQGAAARARGAADHQVPRGAELVPRQPRHDRQRLPLLPRPTRPRTDDELHPLRPRLDPRRPSHAGSGAWAANRYVHSAYQVCDLDALAAGGEYLRERGYFRSWGIGRHIQGSQIFDYWRDPDGFMVEHFADGDMFDSTLEPGWAPFTASGPGPVGTAGHQGLPRHEPQIPSARSAFDDHRTSRATTNSISTASSAS